MKEGRHCHLVKRSLDGGSMIELQEWVGWRVECILENECASRMIEAGGKKTAYTRLFLRKESAIGKNGKGSGEPRQQANILWFVWRRPQSSDKCQFWRGDDALSHCPMSIFYPQIGCGLCQNRIVGADDDIETIIRENWWMDCEDEMCGAVGRCDVYW